MSESALLGFLQWIDLIGVVFNAVLGAVIGRAARLDVVGLAVLAIMSGLGGGMIRDVLLQSGPPIAITDWRYITAALAGAAVVMVVRVEGRWWDRIYPPIDALALGTWAAAGSLKTLEAGFGVLPALMLGTITAVGGGFVRDIVLRRIPGCSAATPSTQRRRLPPPSSRSGSGTSTLRPSVRWSRPSSVRRSFCSPSGGGSRSPWGRTRSPSARRSRGGSRSRGAGASARRPTTRRPRRRTTTPARRLEPTRAGVDAVLRIQRRGITRR